VRDYLPLYRLREALLQETRDFAANILATLREPFLIRDSEVRIASATPRILLAMEDTTRLSSVGPTAQPNDCGPGDNDMKKAPPPSRPDGDQRLQAEQHLPRPAEQPLPPDASTAQPSATEVDALALVHELRVHQIELEMQNEELRRAQTEITVLEARYRELYDFAPIGYLTLDASCRILEANLAGATLLGVGRRELINRSFLSFLSPSSQAAYRSFSQRLQEAGVRQACEFSLLQSDGALHYLQAEAIAEVGSQETDRHIRMALLDITGRKRLEELTRESAQQFRNYFEHIFDQGPLGILFVDLDGRFLHANKQLCAMLGYTLGELLPMRLQDIIHPEDIAFEMENARRQLGGAPASYAKEMRYLRKEGNVFWARVLVTLMRDGQNRPLHFLEIIEDITEQKIAEQGRQSAILQERNRMAHDIHDTLAQGFTGILVQLEAAAYAPEQEQARVHIAQARELARQSLQEARRSVRALRPQALEGENLPGALARLVAQISSTVSIPVQFQVVGAPFTLPLEVEDQLFRIGQEALTNAIKHSEAAEIQVVLSFEPAEARLSIRDDGKGFDTQTGFQGEGFGLIGMYERAEQIGGRMMLDAHPGQGTSITVTIPATPQQKEERRP